MKAITIILTGLITLLPMASGQEAGDTQQNPQLQAQVTLPYAELRRILDQANRKQPRPSPAPPVGAALKSAHFKVSAQSAQGPLRAEAEFSAINLSGEWEWTPLLRGLQVEQIQPAEAMVVNREGVTGLLNRAEGNHQLSLSLSGSPLRFSVAEATSRILELDTAPKGHVWDVSGGAIRISDSRYSIGAGTVSVSLKPLVTEVASTWALRSEMLIEAKRSHVAATCILALNTNEGTGQSARVKLPSEATDIRVEGADLGNWKIAHDSEGQWLKLHWKTARILNRSVELAYKLPTPAADKALIIQPPALNEGETEALVALATEEGIEAAVKEEGSSKVGNLPPWIQSLPRSSEMATQRGNGPFEFSLRYLPRAKTADATIRAAHFDMQVVADGSLLCTADFEISHREWTQWEFTLPEKGALLSCHRNGISADPIISGEQVLSLQLPASSKDSITRVRLMYSAKAGAMDPVEGALTLKLPKTPLFIQQTDWRVRIPDSYKVQAVEGNIEIKPTKKADEGIALTKAFNHGDQPVAQVHYRKKGLDD